VESFMSADAVLTRFSCPILEGGSCKDVYWLEQTEGDVPDGNDWLGPIETECLPSLRFAKRRSDWRLGRWTAKQALAAVFDVANDFGALANMEILAAESGAPEIFCRGEKVPATLSLSHRAGVAMCCVSSRGGCIGCDLETVEVRSPAFIADYFTAKERALIERTAEKNRWLLVALLWSAKESALKALQVGLRLDTKSLEVQQVDASETESGARRSAVPERIFRSPNRIVEPDDWRPLEVVASDQSVFCGWWREADGMVRSILSVAD
jgi:4'-phosphopantetheinyl transferase